MTLHPTSFGVHDVRATLPRALEATPANTHQSPHPFADDPRLAELLALLHLGRLPDRVGARVAELVRDNPPDVLDRLERAADYVRLTGSDVAALQRLALEHGPTPAHDYLATE